MLYRLRTFQIPPKYQPITLALPTPVPTASTSHRMRRWMTTTRLLPQSEFVWPTATQRDLWLAPPWLQCQHFRPLRCKGMLCHLLPTPSSGWDRLRTKVAQSSSQKLQSQSIILTDALSSPDGVISKAHSFGISLFSRHPRQLPQSLDRQPGDSQSRLLTHQLGFSIPTSGKSLTISVWPAL